MDVVRTVRWPWIVVLLGLALSGCAKYIKIKPSELPKLSNSFEKPIDSDDGQLVAVRVSTVETPSGHLVQIEGEFDVCVTLVTGKEWTFRHPIRARLEAGDVLLIESSNWKMKSFSLDTIETLEVTQ
jgi:hypothetical protein